MYNKLNNNSKTESEMEVNRNYTMTIPYICNVSEDVKRIVKNIYLFILNRIHSPSGIRT